MLIRGEEGAAGYVDGVVDLTAVRVGRAGVVAELDKDLARVAGAVVEYGGVEIELRGVAGDAVEFHVEAAEAQLRLFLHDEQVFQRGGESVIAKF